MLQAKGEAVVSLTVIGSLPGAGGPERARGMVLSAVTEGRSGLIVVPSSKYGARLRSGLADVCPVGVRVLAINRLVESEWSLKGDGRRIVGDLHRDMLLSRALVSAGATDRPGRGMVALLATIGMRACAQGVDAGVRASGLSGTLVNALRGYLSKLSSEGLVEAAEATRLLADCAPPADIIEIEGLTSLTPDREALLRGWSASGSRVVVALPWEAGSAATQPLDALVRRLETAGATVEVDRGIADGRPAELARVATELFSGAAPRPGEGSVELGVARGDEAETRLIADRVTGLLARGVRGEQIAVAFGDPGRHVGWLRRSFDDAGLDATWDARIPVPETPLGRSMLRLWSFCAGGMRREDLTAFMRSPFSGAGTDRADRMDAEWRARRVQGPDLLGRVGNVRPLIATCSSLSQRPIDPETSKKWKELADSLLAHAYGPDAPVPGMDGALDAAVHRAFCQALSGVVASGDLSMTPADLWAAFAASSVSPAYGEASGRVTVTSFDGLRGRSFDAVVLGGLTAGETPRRGTDDRLEGDAVLGALRALGLESDPDEQPRMERLAFYLAATAATRSLTLVRRETDEEGRPLRASVFWEEFLDLYRQPGAPIEECPGLPQTVVRAQEDDGAVRGVFCAARGLLSDTAALATLATIDAVSPGDVERYTACPYRWFVERRLRPRTPDAEVDVMVAGLATHNALSAFYKEWTADGSRPRVTPERLGEALALARVAVGRAIADSPAPSTLDEEWLLSSVEPAVLRLVERDARFLPDYAPAEFEWSFGLEDGDEPIDLGGVRIKGRADRIDIGPQGLIVIDYKRSKAKSYAEMGREGLVQLQLYALAASLRLGMPAAGGLYRSLSTGGDRGFVSGTVVGSFFANDVVEPAAIDVLLEQAVVTARAASEGMKAGDITPSPDATRCAYCSALPFCPEGIGS
jgi:RecB family exonuclease